MKKPYYMLLLSLILALPLMLASCGSDDNNGDEPDGPNGGGTATGSLIVNGQEWAMTDNTPVYMDQDYSYWGQIPGSDQIAMMVWSKDLDNAQAGDDATAETLLFPMQDAEYELVSGSVTVTRNSGSHITLKFNNVKYRYVGDAFGLFPGLDAAELLGDPLTISGEVEFLIG